MFNPNDIVGLHVGKSKKLLTENGFSVRVVADKKGWLPVGWDIIRPERINLILNEYDIIVGFLDDVGYLQAVGLPFS